MTEDLMAVVGLDNIDYINLLLPSCLPSLNLYSMVKAGLKSLKW